MRKFLVSFAALALVTMSAAAAVTPARIAPAAPGQAVTPANAQQLFPYPGPVHEVYGVIRAMSGTTLTVQTRRGLVTVDASWAIAHEQSSPLFVSRGVIMHGVFQHNTFVARDVYANNHRIGDWPADS